MTRILFLRQSSIVRGQAHVEGYIAQALHRHHGVVVRDIDLVAEVRRSGIAGGDRAEVMHRYRRYLLEEIIRWAPDCLLLLNGYAVEQLFPGLFASLHDRGIAIAAWHADDPYYFDLQARVAPLFRWVFTVEAASVEPWRRMVPRSYFLPFAFSVDVLESLAGFERDRYASDICFIGAPFKGSRRVGVIDRNAAFLSEFHLRLMGATTVDTWKANLTNYDVVRAGVVDAFIEPEEANRFFASATINLNVHKDRCGHLWDRNSRAVEAISPNERFFAIAGTGAFQLVDAGRPGLRELFPSHLIEEFATDEAFRERITHFLTHEDERNAIAGELRRIVLRDHTYDCRIERMLSLLGS